MQDVVQFYPIMLATCYYCIHRKWMLSSRGELMGISLL